MVVFWLTRVEKPKTALDLFFGRPGIPLVFVTLPATPVEIGIIGKEIRAGIGAT